MSLTYNLKPYAIQKAIADLGGQETLTNLLSTVNANLTAEGLTNPCPQCVSTGRIDGETKECPTCYGWGKTSVVVTVNRTFSPKTVAPTVDLTT